MNIGVILSAVWCPLLRGKVNIKTENERKSNFIGILAVGGMEGGVVIYVWVIPMFVIHRVAEIYMK